MSSNPVNEFNVVSSKSMAMARRFGQSECYKKYNDFRILTLGSSVFP